MNKMHMIDRCHRSTHVTHAFHMCMRTFKLRSARTWIELFIESFVIVVSTAVSRANSKYDFVLFDL